MGIVGKVVLEGGKHVRLFSFTSLYSIYTYTFTYIYIHIQIDSQELIFFLLLLPSTRRSGRAQSASLSLSPWRCGGYPSLPLFIMWEHSPLPPPAAARHCTHSESCTHLQMLKGVLMEKILPMIATAIARHRHRHHLFLWFAFIQLPSVTFTAAQNGGSG